MQPTLEQKQHVLELVQELKHYIQDLPVLMKQPVAERRRIADRMQEIKKELQQFRRDHPDA